MNNFRIFVTRQAIYCYQEREKQVTTTIKMAKKHIINIKKGPVSLFIINMFPNFADYCGTKGSR
jgi:hypothetical protein